MIIRGRNMRLIGFILVIALFMNQAAASDTPSASTGGVEQKLAQKIMMVDHILNSPSMASRIEASGDDVAKQLLARAAQNFRQGEGYFGQGKYLEAEAVIDYVLRDLSAASQLLNVSQLKQNQFKQFIEQLDAFILPEWGDISEDETSFLQQQLEQVSELRNQAIRLADNGSYDDAIGRLEEAYHIKASLLDMLRHETTIVYDLQFDNIQDEYRHLLNRTYHFLELVNYAVANSDVDSQKQKLMDTYIYRSVVGLEQAEGFETEGKFSDAIPILEQSINQLTAALKILGIKI